MEQESNPEDPLPLPPTSTSLSSSTPQIPPPPPESEEHEPALKKTKMSSTTTSDDGDNNPSKPRRYKRRKVAIFLAYCGVGYQGMQKNPGAKTIEGDLEDALYLAGAVPEDERGQHKRYDWARSARTDKGVSAVGQVISGRFFVDPPGFVQRLNSILSPQIRIFGFKRATPTFNAKKFCDRRRYVYLLPVFALDPSSHRDRESVLASIGSGEELVKCVACSDRGRKVFGVMGNKRDLGIGSGISSNSCDALMLDAEEKGNVGGDGDLCLNVEKGSEESLKIEVLGQSGILSNSCDALEEEECNVGVGNENGVVVGEEVKVDVGLAEPQGLAVSGISSNDVEVRVIELEKGADSVVEELKNYVGAVKSEVLVQSGAQLSNGEALSSLNAEVEGKEDNELSGINGTEEGGMVPKCEFKYGEEVKERFNRLLRYYEGTHNFHNFTTRTKAEDPSAKRYIVSFQANTTLTLEGIEFIKCEVVGQSFMLHQIRKMMGMAVAVMRNFAPESIYETAFDQAVRINVPTAPEVGLFLDECLFTSYNTRWHGTHEELSMKSYAEEAEEFKLKHIYSHIADMEHKEGSVAIWLHSLNLRNYPDLCPPSPQRAADPKPEGDTNGVLP